MLTGVKWYVSLLSIVGKKRQAWTLGKVAVMDVFSRACANDSGGG